MLNIAAFINPLSHSPNPTAAVGNANQATSIVAGNNREKERLAEQGREADQRNELGQQELGFRKTEHQDLMEEHRTNLHTKLIEWGTQVLDKEGAEKARQIVGPVWEAAGIGVDFGDQPSGMGAAATAKEQMALAAPAGPDNEAAETAPDDEMAELEAAQGRRGSLDEYLPEASGGGIQGADMGSRLGANKGTAGIAGKSPYGGSEGGLPVNQEQLRKKLSGEDLGPRPGESFSAYVSRNTATPKAKPTEKAVEAQATEGPEAAASDEAAATVAQAPKPWKIIDKKTGRVLGVIDPQKVEGLNRERAAKLGEAYVSGTPESGKPIVEGFEQGARDEADAEKRMLHAEKAISEQEKTLRVEKNHKGGGGPAPLGGPIDEKLLNQVNGQVRMYVSKAVDNSGVKLLNQHAQSAMQIAQMIDSASSGAQRQAFATQLHANFGAASSEGERAFQLEQGGKVQALLAKVDAWVNTGQLPPGLKEEISTVAHMQAKFAQEYAQRVRDQATKSAMDSPALGGLYDRALGHKLTPEERKQISDPVSNLGGIGGEGESPAEPGSADQEFDKLGI